MLSKKLEVKALAASDRILERITGDCDVGFAALGFQEALAELAALRAVAREVVEAQAEYGMYGSAMQHEIDARIAKLAAMVGEANDGE